MRLTELEPKFMKIEDDRGSRYTDSLSEADGIMFLCPKCFKDLGTDVGCHSVICWTPAVPLTRSPGPGRWALVGSSYGDLSLVASPTSVKLTDGCNAHFVVQNGEVTFV